MSPRFHFSSFEDSSVLRKLTILYFIISIVPVSVLYYLYLQLRQDGQIEITEEIFSQTLFWVVLGVGVGYIALRSIFMKLASITDLNKSALTDLLGKQKIQDITEGSSNEISILTKSFNEITSRLEENVRNLELAKKTLHSVLSRVGEGISSMENIDNFLELIVETVSQALQADIGILLLRDDARGDYYVKSIFGLKEGDVKNIRVNMEMGLFKTVVDSRQPLVLEKVPREGAISSILRAPIMVTPLMLHDDFSGFLIVCGRKSEEIYNSEEMNLLQNLALQTAVAIENSRLNEDAEKTYFETISALALAVEAKDPYSRGHLDRVAKYVVMMGHELNLGQDDLDTLRDAAKLHDLGKIGVTDKVLKKLGPLTAQEMDMMKKHCEIGEGIIKPIRSLRVLCDLVRHHHEKLDGSGYPDGLKGDEVHYLVRILTVADIYDALTSSRPYRDPFPHSKALEELRSMKEQLDQRYVEILAKLTA